MPEILLVPSDQVFPFTSAAPLSVATGETFTVAIVQVLAFRAFTDTDAGWTMDIAARLDTTRIVHPSTFRRREARSMAATVDTDPMAATVARVADQDVGFEVAITAWRTVDEDAMTSVVTIVSMNRTEAGWQHPALLRFAGLIHASAV